MKSKLIALSLLALGSRLYSAEFSSGSSGSFGALDVTQDTVIPLPPDGILHCTTITVRSNATLRFTRNPLNTPVYLLAQGDVIIDGTIDVSGYSPAGPFQGGQGGPGGFDGGPGGLTTGNSVMPAGDGLGPGGGKHALPSQTNTPGDGAYSTRTVYPEAGQIYGSPALIPLVGGSGGGGIDGEPTGGGGGGGGAVLIASTTRILINSSGRIVSEGAKPGSGNYGLGSGGAVRLVAPRVFGNGTLNVGAANRGAGRIRIDSIYKFEPSDPANQKLSLDYFPRVLSAAVSVGSTMIVFLPTNPRLDILEAAGTSIPEGNPNSVLVQLPVGTSPNQNIRIQARNFNAKIPIRVVLTPQSGDSIGYDAEIDNSGNPATATVPVTFPVNQVVRVSAWTR